MDALSIILDASADNDWTPETTVGVIADSIQEQGLAEALSAYLDKRKEEEEDH